MIPIVITAISTFVVLLALIGGFGLLSVIVAYVVGRIAPNARDRSLRYIAGWKTRRGLRNRLLLAPLVLTLGIFAGLAVVGLTDTGRVRSKMTESTRLVIRSGGNCHRDLERERLLLEVEDAHTIRALSELISVRMSTPGVHCACCGEMTFDFYRKDELHYSFSLHHGQRIRIKGSSSGDKELSGESQRRLAEWLNQAGVTKALAKVNENEERRMRAELEAMEEPAQTPAAANGEDAPAEP